QLQCDLFNLATGEVLDSQSAELKKTENTVLDPWFYGLKGLVQESPVEGSEVERELMLYINNFARYGNDYERVTQRYNPEEALGKARFFERVSVELPSTGDVVQLRCRLD